MRPFVARPFGGLTELADAAYVNALGRRRGTKPSDELVNLIVDEILQSLRGRVAAEVRAYLGGNADA